MLDPGTSGANATRELAFKILALEGLSDPVRGVKVSVNLVRGGTSRQVTAPEARADVDARVREVAGRASLPGVSIEVTGGMSRPPMHPTARTEALLALATEVGRDIGVPVEPIEKMGGSDGCFASALGVPVLDAMGPLCHDICGETERIELASLVPRTALIAGVVERLAYFGK